MKFIEMISLEKDAKNPLVELVADVHQNTVHRDNAKVNLEPV